MYVCGPTVDNLPHIGHGRFNLTYDVLRRYLLFNPPIPMGILFIIFIICFL